MAGWMKRTSAVAALIAVALAMPAAAGEARKKSARTAVVNSRSMTVRLVRSAEPGCEPNCPEWIVAHGEIVPSTPSAFRKVFRQIGKRRLPIIIDSGGGSVEAAMSIGKMIRERGLDVIVGNTSLSSCSYTSPDCSNRHKDGEPYLGYQVIWSGTCASACPFILAGGVSRMAYGDAIGAHQIVLTHRVERLRYRDTFSSRSGKKKRLKRVILSRKLITDKPTTQLPKSYVKKVRAYFAAMGVDASYVDYFEKATPQQIYYLTASERLATRIINANPPRQNF